jgi:hypothetical protein
MIKHGYTIPNSQSFNTQTSLSFRQTNFLPSHFSSSLLILAIPQKFVELLLQKLNHVFGKDEDPSPKDLKAKQNRRNGLQSIGKGNVF